MPSDSIALTGSHVVSRAETKKRMKPDGTDAIMMYEIRPNFHITAPVEREKKVNGANCADRRRTRVVDGNEDV